MKQNAAYRKIASDICDDIRCGKLRPGDRVASEHELAGKYGVSVITTKSALNMLADKEIVERHRGKGTFVSSKEKIAQVLNINTYRGALGLIAKTIGLIIPSMKTRVDQQLLDSIESEIAKTSYMLAVRITREDQKLESKAVQTFIERGADGLIIFPAENEIYNGDLLRLSYTHFPFVFVDRYLKGIRANSVVCDNREATHHLIKEILKKGKKNIGLISPQTNNSVTIDRVEGFEKALQNAELSVAENSKCMIPTYLTETKDKKEYINNYLMKNPELDGLFCINQEISQYVYEIVGAMNGFDRYALAAFDNPVHSEFIYIRQDIKNIARQCVLLLLKAIDGENTVSNIVVPSSVIINKPNTV